MFRLKSHLYVPLDRWYPADFSSSSRRSAVEANKSDLPSGEKKPQVLAEPGGEMRVGEPICSSFSGATYIAYCFSPAGVAWKMTRAAPTRPSPLVLGDLLFMVNDTGTAYCLDARTGEEIWKESLDGKFSASPVYAEGRIYFTSENGKVFVVAADRTFQLLETNKLEPGCLGTPAVVDGAIFIRTKSHLYRIGK